jgi:hypothetical protein
MNTITAKFANHHGYSDISPFEIVRVISDKTIEVRRMNYTRDPNWKPEIIPGGFCGHCVNQNEQTYTYESVPDAPVFRIRDSKNGWKCADGNKFVLSDAPTRFYDHNF